ncbi:proline racemase family protein [Lysinibacter cavernae]|uniref:Proline racemase n=1 Tax=Lysinibacter cavernae TaxID=1640652 RepID=A0A7X5QYT2_9MICO|nr:proline racemase family protein [Lysinibacter cavernae]NIH52500.1 proline racemase [Lysinibacter cavernae]
MATAERAFERNWNSVTTVDYHTGGEPFRIIAKPPVEILGETVAERRVYAISDPAVDDLRRVLCYEPRGHADMYGGFITPPDNDGAHFGVLFWHKDGFSTACGHGTIALGVWAVDSGLVEADPNGATDVVIDVPSGRVIARVNSIDGQIESVDFVNVASYVIDANVAVATSRGELTVEVGFGGAIYAQLDVAQLGLTVEPEHAAELIAIGREIKWLLNDSAQAEHPTDPRLSGIYGTILFEDLGDSEPGSPHQRNVTIFADGELDRSPCGSGTSTRVASLWTSGRLSDVGVLTHDSIVGSRFAGRVRSRETVAGFEGVTNQVSGMAYRVGESTFTVDARDPLVPGFVLR